LGGKWISPTALLEGGFNMWQHQNIWQHDEYNPENHRQRLKLDHQIESAFLQGTISVFIDF
jgi:hypothetical protein